MDEFLNWLKHSVHDSATQYGIADHDAFAVWAMHHLFDVEQDEAREQCDTLARGDLGIDGWQLDHNDRVFRLLQAKYFDVEPQVHGADDLLGLVKGAAVLRTPERLADMDGKEKLVEVAARLRQAIEDGYLVMLTFCVAGRITDEGVASLRALTAELCDEEASFEADFIDLGILQERVSEELVEIKDLNGKVVRFALAWKGQSISAPAIDLPGVGGVTAVSLDGKSVGEAVLNNKPQIFEANVRYHLGTKNKINGGIRKQLQTEAGRKQFWLNNNGITIVCEKFEFDEAKTEVMITNPQIVNGAQTSYSLFSMVAALNTGDVAVAARIIETTNDDEGAARRHEIAEFTNAQSPIKVSDLRANDARHRKLQEKFRLLTPPVFYERRRGEWDALTNTQRDVYKGGRVKMEDVGQRHLAYCGFAAAAIGEKARMHIEREDEAFNTSVDASVYMLSYELFEQAKSLLKSDREGDLLALVPTLGNPIDGVDGSPQIADVLRRASSLVAAHCVALAHEALEKRYGPIAGKRAAAIRVNLGDSTNPTSKQTWTLVFKTLRFWCSNQPDKSAIKKVLQQSGTLGELSPLLAEMINDLDPPLAQRLPALPVG